MATFFLAGVNRGGMYGMGNGSTGAEHIYGIIECFRSYSSVPAQVTAH